MFYEAFLGFTVENCLWAAWWTKT